MKTKKLRGVLSIVDLLTTQPQAEAIERCAARARARASSDCRDRVTRCLRGATTHRLRADNPPELKFLDAPLNNQGGPVTMWNRTRL